MHAVSCSKASLPIRLRRRMPLRSPCGPCSLVLDALGFGGRLHLLAQGCELVADARLHGLGPVLAAVAGAPFLSDFASAVITFPPIIF